MSDYEEIVMVNASADMVFGFVSDLENLPQYLPTVRHIEPQGADRIRVQGEVQGRRYDSDGHFRADPQAKRLEWGSDGENRYSGWLQVQPEGQRCRLVVHLSFKPRPDQEAEFKQQTGDRDTTIREGIRSSLESIRRICEGSGGKVEPRAA